MLTCSGLLPLRPSGAPQRAGRTAIVTRVAAHSRPSSSVKVTSQTQVVRPRWRGTPEAWTVPSVAGRMNVVWLDWPTAKLPSSATARCVVADTMRLGQRRVGASVHQSGRLPDSFLDRETGAAAVGAGLEQLEAQNVVERALGRIGARFHGVGTLQFGPSMATFDQLSAEQRAIVELVLQQQKSYDDLAGMLGLPEERVRELARGALVDLAPVSARGVEEDWRGQLADYVLGQQSGAEATATKGHLRRSEAARTWTRSLLDSLEQLYVNGSLPAVPEGERGRRAAAAARKGAGAPLASEPASPAVKRRRLIAAAAAAVAALLLIVLVWPVGVLTGGDEDSKPTAADDDTASQSQSEAAGQTAGGRPAGIAIVVEQRGKRQLLVQAANLDPSERAPGVRGLALQQPG